jgi:hypothetical protein
VFVEPLELVAHREAKILQLLRDEVVGLVALLENPLRRPDGGDFAASSGHGDVRVSVCALWRLRGGGCRAHVAAR